MSAGRPNLSRRYLIAAVGLAVAGMLWYAAYTVLGLGPSAVAYVFMPSTAAVGAAAIVALLRAVPLEPAARRFWRLILLLELSLAAGYGVLAIKAFLVLPAPFPAVPRAGVFCVGIGVLAAIIALVRVPLGARSPAERWPLLLDRMIAFLGCGTVLWHFGLAPLFTDDEPWSAASKVLIALCFLLALGGVTKVAHITGGPVDRVAIRLVAASGLVAAAYAVVAVHFGRHGAATAQALFMPLAPMAVTIAVYRQRHPGTGRRQRSDAWMPYLAVAAVDVPLLAAVFSDLRWPGRIVVVAAVVVTVLATIRQYLAFRENARLLGEQRASEERLQYEATHDGLTGLANRALFRARLTAALDTTGAAVLLVDLDDFKTINDSLGHDVGDDVLVAVAGALRSAAGADGLPVRLGGDEFAVLLDDPDGPGEAVLDRIMAELSGPLGEHRLLVHASAGMATADPGTPLDHLLRDADSAMYAAKQRGKANWVRFAHGMERPVLADARLGADLRRALDANEFFVVYQPLIGLEGGRIIGVEALVRWQHPTRGVLGPVEFIPVAERTGLIVPLGRFVLRETCRQTAAWLAEFGPDVLEKAGPNVSVRQLHDPDFVDDVRAALADHGLPGDRLVLELTESAVLRGQTVSRVLYELHDMGVRLALDDFGTGESSLSLLRAFPASIVKLDKSFVDGIELDEPGTPAADARQAVARAVIQLAGALGLDTVAEGIENEEQAERLRCLGYTIGQGFHLARPMGAADVTRLLVAQRDLAIARA
jgi:diguanylate cyclase (GGDEF)-like protein